MNWTNQDWFDLALMIVGALLGAGLMLGVANHFALDLLSQRPLNYVTASVSGTLGGYALRFGVATIWRRSAPACS